MAKSTSHMSVLALKSLLALSYILAGTGNVIAQAQTTAAASASASPCASSIAPRNGSPSVAPGWRVEVVASGLTDPRGILFDSDGALLVVQQASGISRLTLTGDDGACVRAEGDPQTVVDDNSLNHGIALSADGKTLYASSATGVFAWDYDGSQGRTTSEAREIVGEMGDADGHVTRTLLLSQKEDGMLLVSRGSMSNLDPAALDVTTGVSTIKAFQVNNVTNDAYNFAEDGVLLGWGLRNSVGVAEDPITGAIYSVENSVDNFERNGENIHQNNPGEELNFHGYLNGTQVREQGTNYGYPTCYAAWDVNEIPDRDGIDVGTQFAIGTQNDTVNDDICRNNRTGPRLTFPAHTAPLDIKFNSEGTAAWVTFHGSWNRDDPIGYKLSVIAFDGNGSPTAPANSNNSTVDVVSNPDLSRCPSNCIRPVGLAWDSKGRLFMSSDATGEIFVVVREDGGSVDQANPTSGLPSPTGSGPGPSESTGAAVKRWDVGEGSYWVAAAAMAGAIPLMEGMAM